MVTRRQLHLLNREFDIHVRKLKLVNGFKAHNLVIKENTDNGPLIYIDNPLESRVPHAYLTLDEFRKELEKRASRQRDKNSKRKQTEVYFEDSDVDFTTSKKDMRRKKVLGGAKIFEAKRTKSRYFEHTYMPGHKRGKKYHYKSPYYYENRNLSMITYKLMQSQIPVHDDFSTSPHQKSGTEVAMDTQELSYTTTSSAKIALETNGMMIPEVKFDVMVEDDSKSITTSEGIVTSEAIMTSEAIIYYLETNAQAETSVEVERTADTATNTATEVKSDQETLVMFPVPAITRMNHHHKKLVPARLLGLRSGTSTRKTTRKVVSGINIAHNLSTSLLEESSTEAIILNVTKQDYVNNTINFRANINNQTTNTEADLTASDSNVAKAETTAEVYEITTEVNETTTGINEMTTDDDVTESVITSEGNETSKNNASTEKAKAKEQPVRPIWMRPRYKRITTTKTTTTRRTLGVSLRNFYKKKMGLLF